MDKPKMVAVPAQTFKAMVEFLGAQPTVQIFASLQQCDVIEEPKVRKRRKPKAIVEELAAKPSNGVAVPEAKESAQSPVT